MKPIPLLVLLLLGLCGPELAAIQTSDRAYELENYHGYFPCSDCHSEQESNPRPRLLEEEHAEPIEWEDSTGTVRFSGFGEWVSYGDLLGTGALTGRHHEDLVKVGSLLEIASYMEDNGYEDTDSTWVLTHGGANIWCLDCHDMDDRDKLRKLNGETLEFNQSHLLCGQCHGPELRDWDLGLHGRSNGYWNASMDVEGITTRLLCVDCHQPHAPAFQGQTPLAGPVSRIDNLPAHEVHHDDHRGQHDELGPHPWMGDPDAGKEH